MSYKIYRRLSLYELVYLSLDKSKSETQLNFENVVSDFPRKNFFFRFDPFSLCVRICGKTNTKSTSV
jgi:hypothetical protein